MEPCYVCEVAGEEKENVVYKYDPVGDFVQMTDICLLLEDPLIEGEGGEDLCDYQEKEGIEHVEEAPELGPVEHETFVGLFCDVFVGDDRFPCLIFSYLLVYFKNFRLTRTETMVTLQGLC